MTFHFCLDVVFSMAWFLWLWAGILPCTRPWRPVCTRGRKPRHAWVWGQRNARCFPAALCPARCETQGHSQHSSGQKHKVALLVWTNK